MADIDEIDEEIARVSSEIGAEITRQTELVSRMIANDLEKAKAKLRDQAMAELRDAREALARGDFVNATYHRN